jgi:hypothetical protein
MPHRGNGLLEQGDFRREVIEQVSPRGSVISAAHVPCNHDHLDPDSSRHYRTRCAPFVLADELCTWSSTIREHACADQVGLKLEALMAKPGPGDSGELKRGHLAKHDALRTRAEELCRVRGQPRP